MKFSFYKFDLCMYIVLKLLNTFKIYRCDFSIFFVFGFSVLFPFVSPPLCLPRCRLARGLRPHFEIPHLPTSPAFPHLSCSKFLFPSPYLPVPALDASHGKFFFLSPYLPVPALEVPCHVVNSSPLDVPSPAVNSSSHLPTCQFPPWMPHLPR